MPPVKLAALDVGQARIGLAVGERGRPFAFGRGHLAADDWAGLLRFLEAEEVERVVLGLPLRTQGVEGPEAKRVRALGEKLRAAGFDVVYEDERFTTQLAAQRLKQRGKKKRREKGRLDEESAILILESYLERNLAP